MQVSDNDYKKLLKGRGLQLKRKNQECFFYYQDSKRVRHESPIRCQRGDKVNRYG